MRPTFIATMLCLLAAFAAAAGEARSVAVLPFENLSGDDAAEHAVTMLVMGAFSSRGWAVANPDSVAEFLARERVRYLDSLDDAVRARILEETSTNVVVTGSIYVWSEGRNPTVAISARMVTATGELLWSDATSVSSLDTERPFGFGRESTLQGVASSAVARLLHRLPGANKPPRPVRGPGNTLFRSKPEFYVSPVREVPTAGLICVLPLENDTRDPDASRVVGDLLALRLAAVKGLRVVDSSTLRAAALQAGIASFRTIRSDDLERLSALVGTPLFLRGTVYSYGDSSQVGILPELSMELSVEDVSAGRVTWIAQHERHGLDYAGFLLRGVEVTAAGLADRVVSEMIETAEPAFRGTADSSDNRGRHVLKQNLNPEPKAQTGVTR